MSTLGLVLDAARMGALDPSGRRLARFLKRLHRQTRPLGTLDEVVVVHAGLPLKRREELAEVAGIPTCFVEVRSGTLDYAAKSLGFEATRTDLVVFANAEDWPEPEWLESLVAPFEDPQVAVVRGGNLYGEDALGFVLTALELRELAPPFRSGLVDLGNVAFRRDVFETYRHMPSAPLYYGDPRVLARRLWRDGVDIHFVPHARTVRRRGKGLKDQVGPWLRRRLRVPPRLPREPKAFLLVLTAVPSALLTWGAAFGGGLYALGQLPRQGMAHYLRCARAVATLGAMEAFVVLVESAFGSQAHTPVSGPVSVSYHPGPDSSSEGGMRVA